MHAVAKRATDRWTRDDILLIVALYGGGASRRVCSVFVVAAEVEGVMQWRTERGGVRKRHQISTEVSTTINYE